jgi:hypothetical protein
LFAKGLPRSERQPARTGFIARIQAQVHDLRTEPTSERLDLERGTVQPVHLPEGKFVKEGGRLGRPLFLD